MRSFSEGFIFFFLLFDPFKAKLTNFKAFFQSSLASMLLSGLSAYIFRLSACSQFFLIVCQHAVCIVAAGSLCIAPTRINDFPFVECIVTEEPLQCRLSSIQSANNERANEQRDLKKRCCLIVSLLQFEWGPDALTHFLSFLFQNAIFLPRKRDNGICRPFDLIVFRFDESTGCWDNAKLIFPIVLGAANTTLALK